MGLIADGDDESAYRMEVEQRSPTTSMDVNKTKEFVTVSGGRSSRRLNSWSRK